MRIHVALLHIGGCGPPKRNRPVRVCGVDRGQPREAATKIAKQMKPERLVGMSWLRRSYHAWPRRGSDPRQPEFLPPCRRSWQTTGACWATSRWKCPWPVELAVNSPGAEPTRWNNGIGGHSCGRRCLHGYYWAALMRLFGPAGESQAFQSRRRRREAQQLCVSRTARLASPGKRAE